VGEREREGAKGDKAKAKQANKQSIFGETKMLITSTLQVEV